MTRPEELKRLLLDEIADKWTIIVLGVLCESGGQARFNAIRRETDGISQKTLAQCLRRLERNGLITRAILDTVPVGVEYAITPLGHTLKKPFEELFLWAQNHQNEVLKANSRYDQKEQARQKNNQHGPSVLKEAKRRVAASPTRAGASR